MNSIKKLSRENVFLAKSLAFFLILNQLFVESRR